MFSEHSPHLGKVGLILIFPHTHTHSFSKQFYFLNLFLLLRCFDSQEAAALQQVAQIKFTATYFKSWANEQNKVWQYYCKQRVKYATLCRAIEVVGELGF